MVTHWGHRGRQLALFSLVLLLIHTSLLFGLRAQESSAETTEEAIRRIQAGRYTPMPTPATAPASWPADKGMTVENGTGHSLHIHFSGPVSRTVVVPNGQAESVELAVGDYQVAAEVPGSSPAGKSGGSRPLGSDDV